MTVMTMMLLVQMTISVVIVTTHSMQRHSGHYHQLLRSLACDNDGEVVQWPGEQLTVVLDRHKAKHRLSTGVVQWTLPYVSAVTTSTMTQSQPVISASLPVYSNHSHRSRNHRSMDGFFVLLLFARMHPLFLPSLMTCSCILWE